MGANKNLYLWIFKSTQKCILYIFQRFQKTKFYNGLFGSTNKRPNFCKQTVAASALAFFLFSLAIVGWNSCPLTVTLKIYCFLCAGPTSKSWTKLGGPHLPKKKKKKTFLKTLFSYFHMILIINPCELIKE